MKRAMIQILLTALCVVSAMSCRVREYRVDYCGQESRYEGAAPAYPVRGQVELYYTLIATDTDYTFLLDGEELDVDYEADKGFVIRFVMPPRDVTLECVTRNTMAEPVEPGEMLFDYYRAPAAAAEGGGHYELVLYAAADPDELLLCEYEKEDGREETCTEYRVPAAALEECMEVVRRYGMAEWNELEDGVGLDGVRLVCRFMHGDEWVRVTGECMSGDGEKAFDEIAGILRGYTRE